MKKYTEKNVNLKKIFNLHSLFWLWPIWAGSLFWIGYSISKNIYLSKFHNEKIFNQIQANKAFYGPESPLSKRTHKTIIFRNKNNPGKTDTTMKKIIHFHSDKASNSKLEINYSQVENLKNQAVYKNNTSFFAEETVKSLMKPLKNTKKPKSSKIESD